MGLAKHSQARELRNALWQRRERAAPAQPSRCSLVSIPTLSDRHCSCAPFRPRCDSLKSCQRRASRLMLSDKSCSCSQTLRPSCDNLESCPMLSGRLYTCLNSLKQPACELHNAAAQCMAGNAGGAYKEQQQRRSARRVGGHGGSTSTSSSGLEEPLAAMVVALPLLAVGWRCHWTCGQRDPSSPVHKGSWNVYQTKEHVFNQ
jgi:hypothetical protein